MVLYCVEWATDGLSIVGSPLEPSDKSCFNNNMKCVCENSSFEKIRTIPINLILIALF